MPLTSRRFTLVVGALCGAALFGSCGGDDDADEPPALPGGERAILTTVDELQTASRQGDAKRICTDIFTETLATSIRRAAKRSCAAEVRATLVTPEARLSVGRNIRISGSRATAIVREQDGATSKLFLVKQGSEWRIDRITPAGSS